ncbi:MAG: hypothetical protein HRU09_18115 [Oligoflexales bacterium]|nr:hypothetical protein [Oligoflexales bacterium]
MKTKRAVTKRPTSTVSTNTAPIRQVPQKKGVAAYEPKRPQKLDKTSIRNLEIQSKIREKQADLAITATSPQSQLFEEFESQTLVSGNFFLYSKDYLEIRPDEVLLIDHADIDIFTYNQQLMQMNPELKTLKSRELPSWSMIGAYIKEGAGIGMLPEFIGDHLGLQKISEYREDRMPKYEIRALWLSLKVKSKLSTTLIDHLKS